MAPNWCSAFNSWYCAGAGVSWRSCSKYVGGGHEGMKKDGLVIWGFILICCVGKSLLEIQCDFVSQDSQTICHQRVVTDEYSLVEVT